MSQLRREWPPCMSAFSSPAISARTASARVKVHTDASSEVTVTRDQSAVTVSSSVTWWVMIRITPMWKDFLLSTRPPILNELMGTVF